MCEQICFKWFEQKKMTAIKSESVFSRLTHTLFKLLNGKEDNDIDVCVVCELCFLF